MNIVFKAKAKNRLSSIVSRFSFLAFRSTTNDQRTTTDSSFVSCVFRPTNNDQRTTILSLLTVFFLLITSMGWGQTKPGAFNLSSGNYSFSSWSSTSTSGTYPSNMIFWRTGTNDPSLSSSPNADYSGAYNGTSGTRMNGNDANGFSWTNVTTAGNLGIAVIGLNTTGRQSVQVSWTGRMLSTLTYNATSQNRFYSIRLQYYVGANPATGTWTDVTGPVEFTSNSSSTAYRSNGASQNLGPTTLPAACDNQSEVYIRWFYYSASGTSGTRPSLGVDEISITSSAALSNDANLSALSLSSGTLSPTFSSGTTSYTSSVASAVSSITVTPTRNQANATIEARVNGGSYSAVTSGSPSGSLSLDFGDNSVDVRVTAQDGTTQKTYSITVTRAAAAGANADLSVLTLSSGTLSPAFAAGTTAYSATVSNASSSITVTPSVADANATVSVRVNSGSYASVNSGSASSSLSLNVGSNTIDVRVTAQDGTTIKTYTITVTRQSNDATLSGLTMSSGTLSPSFASGTTSYTASVSNATTFVAVTPNRNQDNATIQVRVNGGSYSVVTSGSASGNLSLNVGSNTINVLVTAQDNSFTQTYTITVTRAASAVSSLSALTISSVSLSPTFTVATITYTASVANATGSVTVTPTVTEANATIQVRVNSGAYASVNSGSASGSLSLNEGSNTINVLVTAQDGTTTTTYTITVTRLLDYINLTSLNTAVTENFDGMGASIGAVIPSGFGIQTGSTTNISTSVTEQSSSGTPTAGGSYNWGQSASERSLGFMFSGSYSGNNIIAKVRNNTGSTINTFNVSFDYEQYRKNTTSQVFKLQYSTSLTSGWTDVTGGNFSNIVSGTSSYGFSTLVASQSISNLVFTPASSVASGADVYFRWTLNGSSSSNGVGIDNFSITASVSATAPTLTAAANATVDGPFTITFSDNLAWRTAISSITVDGTTLSTSAYTVSAGQITFTPSASALLQSSGDKSIAVLATGYANATVTQTIGVGAATQLVVTTQPVAPATNGGSLATQPIVAIRDQYNNTLTGSSASVTAAVGSSGTWTLGGTKTINASSGVATFSGLTASNSTSVTDATILFTSGALSVTSSSFNIPAPAPANNNCGSATTITLNATAISGTLDGATVISPFSGKIDVWYKFVPSCSGTQTVTVSGFTGDVDVELFEGSLCPSTTSFLDNSAGSTSTESITGSLTSGTTYYVRVLAFDATAQTSTFSIAVTEANCPSPVLNAPVAGTATLVYNNGFQANWSSATDATGYRLDVSTAPIATDLFISEYVEGSSNNKYIELYNGTGRSVDLSDYRLMLFANGGTTPTNNILLTGTLASGSVIVYKNSSAALTLPQGVTAADNAAIAFNGDDAIALFKISSNSYVDIFGNIGEDPGIAWTATNTTLDRTLRRKSTVTGGVTTNPASGFSTLATEWDQFIENTVSGLGSHTSNANPSFVTGFSNLSVNDTKRLVTGLNANTTYYYVVRSTDATRTSSNSNIITVTTANSQAGPLPNIWVGEMNGSWNNAANWSYGTIPSSTGNTLIDDGTPLLDIDFTLASTGILTLADNGSLVIGAGKTLSIAGSADFGDRPVTLKSTSTGTAAIGQVTGTLSGATAVTVERYMPAQRRWRMLTAPLTGSTNNSIYYNWQNNNSASGSTGAIFWGPSAINGLYAGGNGYNLLRFNSSTGVQGAWENVTSTTAAGSLFDVNTNKPYIAFITGPYNTSGNYISGSPATTTLSATGTLRTGQVPFTGLNGGVGSDVRFHMIGNPYASAVTFSAITTSGTSGFFYVWDPKVGSLGAYSAIPSNSATLLESGQAFLVGVPSGNTGSVTFDEADKSSTTNNVMFRTQNTNPRATIKLYKTVNNNLTLFDQAWVDYQPDANPEIDGNDAPKPSNFTENLSIFRNGRDLMVERRPMFTQNDTLQLRLWRTQQTSYQMQLTMENFSLPAGSTAVLEDRYLNTSTPIVLSGQQTINFSVNADPASSGERFRIVFRPSVVTSVNNLNSEKGFRMYPNPVAKGSHVQLEFRNKAAGKYTLTLYTIAGVQIQQSVITHIGGTSAQPVKLLSHLSAGTYVAEIAGAKDTEKIMLTFE